MNAVPFTPRRILCAASCAYGEGSTSWHRVEAIRELGHRAIHVDSMPLSAKRLSNSLGVRALRKLFRVELDWGNVGYELIKLISRQHFDGFWIDKGTMLSPVVYEAFRRRFPRGRIIGYSPDDMMTRSNHSRRFVSSLPYYDIYFTTKSFQVSELHDLGCKRVQFVGNAYHSKLHRPVPVCNEDRERFGHPVIFIGSYEEERATFIRYLAENGISVRVWGDSMWRRVVNPPPLMQIEGRPVFAEDYVKAICASDICLCFLRKLNRDRQTTRSIEIPACGTLMVAERTEEHLSLFAEGKEAVFFETKEELLDKVTYFMNHSERREEIANAGRNRCLNGGYSNLERMRSMLNMAFANAE